MTLEEDLSVRPDPESVPRFDEPRTPTRSIIACRMCVGTGLVFASRRETPGFPTIFRCACPAGERSRRNFPRWEDVCRSAYEVESRD